MSGDECSSSSLQKPKVRFSQCESLPPKVPVEVPRPFTEPRIRSIVEPQTKVKIVKPPPVTVTDATPAKHSAGDAPNDLRFCPVKSTPKSLPCLTEITLTPENNTAKPRMRQPVGRKPVDTKKAYPASSKSCSSLPAKITKDSQTKQTATRIGKENIPDLRESETKIHNVPPNTERTSTSTGTKSSSRSTITKKPEIRVQPAITKKPEVKAQLAITKKPEVKAQPAITKKPDVKAQPVTMKKPEVKAQPARKATAKITNLKKNSIGPRGLMPCMRAPIKKTILRNVSTTKLPDVYVGPGVPRPQSLEPEAQEATQTSAHTSRSEILAGERLARPEYNSIVCTIKQLRKAREERVAKDFEHLSTTYKKLINGKVINELITYRIMIMKIIIIVIVIRLISSIN